MEDSRHQHMTENRGHRRHHDRSANVGHFECKAGTGEKEWHRYHVTEKDKIEKYNVSETIFDEKQHNVHEKSKSEEQDSLYVMMTSCEQAMHNSVHGKHASRTYSAGLEKDNNAQCRMQETSDDEGQHTLKDKIEHVWKYMPYLAMTSHEKAVNHESKIGQNSYSKARINLSFLSLHKYGRQGYNKGHNRRGDSNGRDIRPDSIAERPLSVGNHGGDSTHIFSKKRVALPPPPPSGRLVGFCARGQRPVPKSQHSTLTDMPLVFTSEKVDISRRTNLSDGSLSFENENFVEKQTANRRTKVAVHSRYIKDFPSGSSSESAIETKGSEEPSPCDTYTVITRDKKEHEEVHLYTQLQDGTSFDVTLIPTDASCKCQFTGLHESTLTVDRTKLQLAEKRTTSILCEWPYTAIRRISVDHSKNVFQIEAGRKCSSGPGIFRFYAAESRTIYKLTMQAMSQAEKR